MSAGARACPECEEDLAHCHDAVVVHDAGGWECLAVECRLGRGAHVLVVSCDELGPGCGCDDGG